MAVLYSSTPVTLARSFRLICLLVEHRFMTASEGVAN
jgi:hypothetical protein